MKVLGLDPGSRAAGFGVVESVSGRLSLLDCGVWRVAGEDLACRLDALFRCAETVLARHSPGAVSVETVFSGRNVASAVALSHARGVLLLAAARAGVPVFEYEPLVVKKALTGYGRAEKPQVREMVRSLLASGSRRMPLDAADALAVAICHCHHSTGY